MPEMLEEEELKIIRACLARRKAEKKGFWFWYARVGDERALLLRPKRRDQSGTKIKRAIKDMRKRFKKVAGRVPAKYCEGSAELPDKGNGLKFVSEDGYPNFRGEIRQLAKAYGLKKLIGSKLVISDGDVETENLEDESADFLDTQALTAVAESWDYTEDTANDALERLVGSVGEDEIATLRTLDDRRNESGRQDERHQMGQLNKTVLRKVDETLDGELVDLRRKLETATEQRVVAAGIVRVEDRKELNAREDLGQAISRTLAGKAMDPVIALRSEWYDLGAKFLDLGKSSRNKTIAEVSGSYGGVKSALEDWADELEASWRRRAKVDLHQQEMDALNKEIERLTGLKEDVAARLRVDDPKPMSAATAVELMQRAETVVHDQRDTELRRSMLDKREKISNKVSHGTSHFLGLNPITVTTLMLIDYMSPTPNRAKIWERKHFEAYLAEEKLYSSRHELNFDPEGLEIWSDVQHLFWTRVAKHDLREAVKDDIRKDDVLTKDQLDHQEAFLNLDVAKDELVKAEKQEQKDETLVATKVQELELVLEKLPDAAPFKDIVSSWGLTKIHKTNHAGALENAREPREQSAELQKNYELASEVARQFANGNDVGKTATLVMTELSVATAKMQQNEDTIRHWTENASYSAREYAASVKFLAADIDELLEDDTVLETDPALLKEEVRKAYAAWGVAKVALKGSTAKVDKKKSATGDKAALLQAAANRQRVIQERPMAIQVAAKFKGDYLAVGTMSSLKIWSKADRSRMEEQLGGKLSDFRSDSNSLMMRLETFSNIGATVDDFKLVYAGWPDVWNPPFLRKQEENWISVQEFLKMDDEAIRLAAATSSTVETVADYGSQYWSTASTGFMKFMKFVKGDGPFSDLEIEEFSKATKPWQKFTASAVALYKGVKKLKGAVDEDAPDLDPIQEMMVIDDLVDSITAIESSTVKFTFAIAEIAGQAFPGVTAGLEAKALMQAIVDVTARWLSAVQDAEVHDKAKEEGHRIEASADRIAKKGKTIATRGSIDAALKLIKLGGQLGIVAGPHGLAVGTAVRTGASVVSGIKSLVEFGIDRTDGERAKKMLDRARIGDADARAEIFRVNGRFAIALLAVLAEDGDAMALAILNNHRVTPEMAAKSSAAVIKKYMMKEMKESDKPKSWSALGDSITGGLSKVGSFFGAIGTKLQPLADWISGFNKDLEWTEDDVSSLASTANKVEKRVARMPKTAALQTEISQARMELISVEKQFDELIKPDKDAIDFDAYMAQNIKLVDANTKVIDARGKIDEVLNDLKAKGEITARLLDDVDTELGKGPEDPDLGKLNGARVKVFEGWRAYRLAIEQLAAA